MNIRQTTTVVALIAGSMLAVAPVLAQGKKSDSVVKVSARGEKPGADGKQVVHITLEMEPKWHVYANPVGNEDIASNQTTVSITSKSKLESVKIDYPAGELVKDKVVGDYKIYKGKVTIKATIQRGKDDTGALDVTVKLQACSDKECLLPATVKTSVP
jgi:hypothetical protein